MASEQEFLSVEERAKELYSWVTESPAGTWYEKMLLDHLRLAKEEGRREALASLGVPGAPMTQSQLDILEEYLQGFIEASSVQSWPTKTDLKGFLKLFDQVRYLQGPILDALGHGELEQYRMGLEEGRKVREVWVLVFEHRDGSCQPPAAFGTKEEAVNSVRQDIMKGVTTVSDWAYREEDGRLSWECDYERYLVYKVNVRGEDK